ncbi:DoxX family protein [Arcobacter sp. YIC-80]|uniref:DoxX family protein n=1 Tax=unclassified Arcobacter TaxID=2593671 RepID=UPI00385163CB
MLGNIINKKSIYYATTLFIALLVGFYGGIVDILQTNAVFEVNKTLQYPLYFFPMLGVFKILGAIALLLPRNFSTIKQWAYAGFTFDFIAASYSHFAVGDSVDKVITPLVILGILAISYFLKNKF